MENKLDVAKLENADLRDIWPDEARDFTPWLASDDGLERLGKVIGLDLVRIGTEVQAGPFSADILAKVAAEEDHKVVIENQLGKTNHDHLGKAITYAAVLGAKTLVWVSPQFTEEHREALDWLNRNTEETVNFFGLELRAYKIDNSRPAPQFSVISRPNAIAKEAQETVRASDADSKRQLMVTASQRHVEGTLNILLKLGEPPLECVWLEPNPRTWGGSIRCWRRELNGSKRMVLGINISGQRFVTPDGQLDIWLPIKSIARVADVSEDVVSAMLEALPIYSKENVDWIIRVTNESQAQGVVDTLAQFFSEHPGFYGDDAE